MKEPKLTKEGKLPQLHDVRARLYANDIMQLFLDRLSNHTLSEVCKYIAGYFYRQQINNFNKLKERADRIEQLEAALRKIADIEHEDLPKPSGAAEGTLWAILAGCVEVAEAALEKKDD